MQRRDFDHRRDYDYDYGSPGKRHRHRLEGEPLLDRDDDRIEARLSAAEQAIRDLVGLVREQRALIDHLRTEVIQSTHDGDALRERLSDLEELVGERDGDTSVLDQLDHLYRKVDRHLGHDSEASDAEGSATGGSDSDGSDEGDDEEWEL